MIERSKAASPTKRLRSSLRAFGPDGAFREGLRSAFDLEPSDVGPLRLSALGGCAVIAAYGIASPLLEVVALSLGMDLLPLVDVGQTLLVFAVNPLYQYAQRWVLPTQLIGIAYRVIATLLLALSALAASWPHSRAVAYCLAVYGGIVALYPPVLYDSFLASEVRQRESERRRQGGGMHRARGKDVERRGIPRYRPGHEAGVEVVGGDELDSWTGGASV
ncbi:hypothetical protein EMIHUDRAFT_233955 [Emiliania huxleyi CCMP1516]|uniref:Uncharacterized protein n=2 Tax=Emiliania huxleyi TaxID=2903 RepID=A0A0D3K121_EMIH1|nr:hypothetical protein EMIHUDRAFT_233955 [Emiliania huxleyi CCMP1516]EOD29456.1 hypothetical protein EMIHUDRAFT_233955 [Emiliania huxleyi CCMP1516]|eukprot:XP_005781885.1 hypothetical protein EMIHUDRAFT_233955 [Emiliania huxleyi CCMP1516]